MQAKNVQQRKNIKTFQQTPRNANPKLPKYPRIFGFVEYLDVHGFSRRLEYFVLFLIDFLGIFGSLEYFVVFGLVVFGIFGISEVWNCEALLCSMELALLKEILKAQGTCTVSKTSTNFKLATFNPFGFGICGMWICEIVVCAFQFRNYFATRWLLEWVYVSSF